MIKKQQAQIIYSTYNDKLIVKISKTPQKVKAILNHFTLSNLIEILDIVYGYIYNISTSNKNNYILNENFVNFQTDFSLKTKYTYDSKNEDIDEGDCVSIEYDFSIFKEVKEID